MISLATEISNWAYGQEREKNLCVKTKQELQKPSHWASKAYTASLKERSSRIQHKHLSENNPPILKSL
jgi:hypothetical protein